MSTWLSRTALGAVLLAAVAAVSGCAGAGQLHDAGPAREIAARPSPQLLWPAAETTSVPSPEAVSSSPPPSPLPGITVPGDDIRTVDAPTVLAKDPALRKEEQAALTGCQGCLVRPAQYRDLTGDGRPELITAVLTGPAEAAYLHVYAARDGQLRSLLSQKVLSGFTADTVGAKLLVHEPSGAQAQTDTTYGWNDVRLVPISQEVKGTGPTAEATLCVPTEPPASADPTRMPEPKVSAVPTVPAPKAVVPTPTRPGS